MRNPLTITGLVTVAAWAAVAAPASAQSVTALAAQECREERRFDRWEFRQDYRGTGAAALSRCVREQKREARRDCREERREEPAEFRAEYGDATAAFTRCVKDELR